MPLTTRPPVTSRQGMMRLASKLDEPPYDLNAGGSRLLRVKLHAEDVSLFERGGVGQHVLTDGGGLVAHRHVVAVCEVQVWLALDQLRRLHGRYGVPTHV